MDTNTIQETIQPDVSGNPEQNKKLETKRIIIFLAITFILTYILEIGVIRPLITGADTQLAMIGQSLVATVMFLPAIGVVLTRLITREGFRNSLLRLPQLKSNLPYYLLAWFGPAVLTVVGSAVYFLLNPGQFDSKLTMLAQTYQNSGIEMSTTQLQTTMLIQIATAFLLGPLLNVINCFGEEWGWRGYLLPKMMKKFNIIPMLLINGVIWGVWHAPLTALGHNYGLDYPGFPYIGIIAMVIFCIVTGTIFSYITIKTNSCIPAIFAHGSLNSIASVGIYFAIGGGNPFIGPAPTGILGGMGFIIIAIIMAVLLIKREKKATI